MVRVFYYINFTKEEGKNTRCGVYYIYETQYLVLCAMAYIYYNILTGVIKEWVNLRCPFCGVPDSKVIDSRATDEGNSIRRRRECSVCARRFTTYEVVEEIPLMVIKKDGRREMYERSKLLGGLLKACEKRPVPIQVIETAVNKVEKDIHNSAEREISTRQIGESVMQHLKEIDQVAYVRFASVYRQFADINNFMQELELLMKTQHK
ncbi:MAG: nrdR [Firmicutes bacterium]|nr:nrdR [Bacillota bacterium]